MVNLPMVRCLFACRTILNWQGLLFFSKILVQRRFLAREGAMPVERTFRTICGLALCLPLSALAVMPKTETQLCWSAVGQIGGPVRGVAVQGNYAYVGVGVRLVVLDVSSPSSPREVGATKAFPYFVEDIAIGGTRAYVAAGEAGLRVVDVSDPTKPNEVGFLNLRGYAEGVAIVGSTVYLADGPYGLRIIDASDPKNPREVGNTFNTNYAFKVSVSGRYAYIAGAGAGLLIADVADPTHPLEVGSYETPGYAYGVTTVGDTAYVADGWQGLRIVDVSDRAHPREVGSYKTPGWAFGVAVSGALAYVADAFRGLRVVDVSNPSQPIGIGGYEGTRGHAGCVVVRDNIAYVADRDRGFRVIDVSNSLEPTQVGLYDPPSEAWHVVVVGHYAYISTNHGLCIVDVSDGSRPRQVGSYDADGLVVGARVARGFAYVAVNCGKPSAGLHIVDVSDPTLPRRVGFLAISPYVGQNDPRFGIPRAIAVEGDVAYITNEQGLLLIGVSDPTNPLVLGFVNLDPWGPSTEGVAVSGTRAYVVKQNSGLAIIDVSNPRTPVVRGSYSNSNIGPDVDVAGNLAFTGDVRSLQVLDVSAPNHPVALGSLEGFGEAVGITASGNLVYGATGQAGLQVIDVSNPSSPTWLQSYPTLGYARKAFIADNYVCLADGTGGLLILQRAATSTTSDLNGHGYVHTANFVPPSLPSFPPRPARRQIQAYDRLPAPRAYPSPSRERARPVAPARRETVARPAPTIAGTCLVNSPADGGSGTLRWCLENSMSGASILFDPTVFPPDNPVLINLEQGLPPLTQGNLTIDASNAGVMVSGYHTPQGTDGLVITSDGNVIKGLQVRSFHGDGIVLEGGARNNILGGDSGRGSGPTGEGNLIGGNNRGVFFSGPGTQENLVIGSVILGCAPCIAIGDGATNNRIGGAQPGNRNFMYEGGGILIDGDGTTGNAIIGNYIGLDASGTVGSWNGNVLISRGASYNTIGGLAPGEGNVISGGGGVFIDGDDTIGNAILGNYIGTNADGSAAIGNQGPGIWISACASVVQGNLISGNRDVGIFISYGGYNTVIGNLIGTDASGSKAMGNLGGVYIFGEARYSRIGGKLPGERNIISGNGDWHNVSLGSEDTVAGTVIVGNYIGTDITGTAAISSTHQRDGIVTWGAARHTFIGGTTPAERNVIAGNSGNGINAGSERTFIGGNYVGTDATGARALGNGDRGIRVESAQGCTIQNNVIAHNSLGIGIKGFRNTIRRNSIFANSRDGGIVFEMGTNAPPAPTITSVSATGVSGTACAGCELEIFSDSEDEGRTFEGSTVADQAGAFVFTTPGYLTGPNVTATATDSDGSTSAFSAPRPTPGWPVRRHVPRR